jgi:large subunit ribosomal protein L23
MFKPSLFDIIRRPLLTEKAINGSEFMSKYYFVVSPDANKFSVRRAVESIFEVKVSKVNIINVKGKVKRVKGVLGKRSDVKKAIVTLDKGNTIDFTKGVK